MMIFTDNIYHVFKECNERFYINEKYAYNADDENRVILKLILKLIL